MYQSANIIYNIIKEIDVESEEVDCNNDNYHKSKNEYTWKAQGGHILLEEIDGTIDSVDSADK